MKSKVQRALILIFVAGCLVRTSGGLQASSPAKGTAHLSIELSTTQSQYKIGTPILVTITLTNNGKTNVVWQSERPEPGYRNFWFSLKTAENIDAPMTVYHRKIRGKQRPQDPVDVASGSSMLATLPPGQSSRFVIDLNKIYEIDKPGTYSLIIGRDDELNKINIRSKSLQVALIP